MVLLPRPSPAPSLRLSHQHSAVFYDGGRLSLGVPSSVARAGQWSPACSSGPAGAKLRPVYCCIRQESSLGWIVPFILPRGSSTCPLVACQPWSQLSPGGELHVAGLCGLERGQWMDSLA